MIHISEKNRLHFPFSSLFSQISTIFGLLYIDYTVSNFVSLHEGTKYTVISNRINTVAMGPHRWNPSAEIKLLLAIIEAIDLRPYRWNFMSDKMGDGDIAEACRYVFIFYAIQYLTVSYKQSLSVVFIYFRVSQNSHNFNYYGHLILLLAKQNLFRRL